ncbi:peptidylprolyl isomerase [Tropicimonas sp. S265A]|uniref:peptidylprolyl isomerase n=1 Tax=Tropicimonas sp. S265A TaxID=3415134 RepID=UPI003C7C7814
MTRRFLTLVIALFLPAVAVAQSFSPIVTVNGEGITQFELEQRQLLLEALRIPGATQELVTEALIEDRLKLQAARRAGLVVSQDELEEGLEDFAQRGNLSALELIDQLADNGVAPETFRDFVEAGLVWRTLVRARFGPRSAISDAEVERALALSGTQSGARILLAEIILPTQNPQMEAQANALADQIRRQVRTTAQFADAARRFSAAPSRENGGQRDWVSLSELQPQLASLLLTLAPGEISEPVPLGAQAIGLFQVRALEEQRARIPTEASVEYATLALPLDPAQAAQRSAELSAQIDTCDDLYPVARSLPEEALVRETVAANALPSALTTALALLDPNESMMVSTARGPVFLMLCGRVSALAEEAGIERIQNQLRSQRISTYADSYLEELRADATIVR